MNTFKKKTFGLIAVLVFTLAMAIPAGAHSHQLHIYFSAGPPVYRYYAVPAYGYYYPYNGYYYQRYRYYPRRYYVVRRRRHFDWDDFHHRRWHHDRGWHRGWYHRER